MGCCNQAPKGQAIILNVSYRWIVCGYFSDRRSLGVIRNPRYCKYTVMFIQTL